MGTCQAWNGIFIYMEFDGERVVDRGRIVPYN